MKERTVSLKNQLGGLKAPLTMLYLSTILTHTQAQMKRFAGNGQNITEIESGSELNSFSGELNHRITQEMSC